MLSTGFLDSLYDSKDGFDEPVDHAAKIFFKFGNGDGERSVAPRERPPRR